MISALYSQFLLVRKVSTDTRTLEPGALFFALRGPNFNANQLAEEALAKGASQVVIDDEAYMQEGCLLVEDVLTTLQDLALHHRQQLKIPVIGLTGSNGKTTTKELIREVLTTTYRVLATRGNLNNHIGVPLTLLSIDDTVEIAVIEMGANKPGDIAELSAIARPTHGLITNIGKAHVGTFGGFEMVLRTKSELYDYLRKNDGEVWINSEQEILRNMGKRFPRPMYYPEEGGYYHCRFLDADPYVRLVAENGEMVSTRIIGGYNFDNIATALAVGKYFNVAPEKAHAAIAAYAPQNNRSQLEVRGTNRLIMDAYNANPSSMEAALRTLAGMKAPIRVAILGDMYELGNEGPTEHERMARLAAELGIEEVWLCGELMQDGKKGHAGAKYFATKEELIAYLKAHLPQHAIVLVKGSRGMGLEAVYEVF
jgi:UDP-N-acetylmuramoyl-tripeptide--D-alanyl-D-alanine ligase